jgi:hypothetical protein
MALWLRKLPQQPGLYWHRNLENAGGRAPIEARLMFVGYVNWLDDPGKGYGTKPTPYMPARLRAVRIEHPMTADSLTVQEWAGEWRSAKAEGV